MFVLFCFDLIFCLFICLLLLLFCFELIFCFFFVCCFVVSGVRRPGIVGFEPRVSCCVGGRPTTGPSGQEVCGGPHLPLTSLFPKAVWPYVVTSAPTKLKEPAHIPSDLSPSLSFDDHGAFPTAKGNSSVNPLAVAPCDGSSADYQQAADLITQ